MTKAVQQRLQVALFEAQRNADLGTEMIRSLDATPAGQITVHLRDIHLTAIEGVLGDPSSVEVLPLRTMQVFSRYVDSAELVQQMVAEVRRFVATHHGNEPHGNPAAQAFHFKKRLREFLLEFTAASLAVHLLADNALGLDQNGRKEMQEARLGSEQDLRIATEGLMRSLARPATPEPEP